jgi:hypothetical protein
VCRRPRGAGGHRRAPGAKRSATPVTAHARTM